MKTPQKVGRKLADDVLPASVLRKVGAHQLVSNYYRCKFCYFICFHFAICININFLLKGDFYEISYNNDDGWRGHFWPMRRGKLYSVCCDSGP
ncbi:hypothetical protein [Undibacterium sp. Tian12W]|uniref:hypothetical protein n=1 Tax=Undibacterium sp. Tian12W TaxID=3413054 RepID=UPI003BF57355